MTIRTLLRRARVLTAGLLVAGATGCIDEIVEVTERDVIPPDQLTTAAGAAALYAGALQSFGAAIDGNAGGTEGQTLISGMLTDEWFHSGTFSTRVDYDMRAHDLNNGTLAGVYRVLNDARTAAARAIVAVQNTSANAATDARIPALQNRIGYVFLAGAMNYCAGVTFSDVQNGQVIYGQPLTTTQMLDAAIAEFDKALAGPAGTANVNHNTARLLKARALVMKGTANLPAAAALVASVPTNFRALSEHSIANGTNENGVFVFNHNSRRWSMAHRDGINGLPFRGAGNGTDPAQADPRLRWTFTGLGFDNTSAQYNWLGSGARDAAHPFAKGEEARLIEAEADLQAGNVTGWLNKLNALRTTVTGLAPLADPGTAAARVDLLFAERGFWLFGTGSRLMDLRRLVRQTGGRRTPCSRPAPIPRAASTART
jgi:starch-binding outer membrane protein, SusD/RagB family